MLEHIKLLGFVAAMRKALFGRGLTDYAGKTTFLEAIKKPEIEMAIRDALREKENNDG